MEDKKITAQEGPVQEQSEIVANDAEVVVAQLHESVPVEEPTYGLVIRTTDGKTDTIHS